MFFPVVAIYVLRLFYCIRQKYFIKKIKKVVKWEVTKFNSVLKTKIQKKIEETPRQDRTHLQIVCILFYPIIEDKIYVICDKHCVISILGFDGAYIEEKRLVPGWPACSCFRTLWYTQSHLMRTTLIKTKYQINYS